LNTFEEDMRTAGVYVEYVRDRTKWMFKVADPKNRWDKGEGDDDD